MQKAMEQHDMVCHDPIIPDGIIHRFGKNNNSWYVCFGNAGAFGDFKLGISEVWSNTSASLSAEDKKQLKQQIAEAKRIREKETTKRQEETAKQTLEEWSKLSLTGTSAYLTRKQVLAHGIRFGNICNNGEEHNFIAIPLYDTDGILWSLQKIYEDGRKRFLIGGKKQGCFYTIGTIENGKPFYITEGYATGASVHMATDLPVAIAFDAGNLEHVTAALHYKYPDSSITIAADNDQWSTVNTGKKKAEDVASKYGHKVILPEFSDQYACACAKPPTDFNDLHVLEGVESVKQQLQVKAKAHVIIPSPFRLTKEGVFFVPDDTEKPHLRLCSPLHITAYTHDEEDNNHGRLLRWKSAKNGKLHSWALPCRLLAGDGTEIIARLLDEGLEVTPGRTLRNKLLEYIQAVIPPKAAISLSRIGWHGEAFALPDQVFPTSSMMVLQTESRHFDSFKTVGELEEWQQHVARYAEGNSRLTLALCTAFSAPLLAITNEESGILHLVGGSSKGKTSALRMAASIWGSGGENGFIRQWRATSNALEAIAEGHRDCLLVLDEMGQADSKTVGDTVYMLANNQGKGRLQSSTALRKSFEWRVMVLSSGEITLESKMAEAGKKPMAGMHVRCINIPAEVEGGYGVFENLHGFGNGDAFSRHLKETCSRYYGTAIRAYLPHIVRLKEQLPDIIKVIKEEFLARYVPKNADGQVQRVAGRFALIAASGELAIDAKILPFTNAIEAIGRCFTDWLEQRGSINSSEIEDGIEQVKAFFERYGSSKFITIDEASNTEISDGTAKIIERIGYKQKQEGQFHYYVFPGAYNSELCKGYNPKTLTRALVERGYLIPDNSGKNQCAKNLPGIGKKRMYHFSPVIMAEEEEV